METASFFPRLFLLFPINLWTPSKNVFSFTFLFVCSVGRRIIGKLTINDSRPTLLCRKFKYYRFSHQFISLCLCYFVWLKIIELLKMWSPWFAAWMSYWIILLASVAAPVKCNKLEQMGKMIAWANITSNTLLELTLIIIVIHHYMTVWCAHIAKL